MDTTDSDIFEPIFRESTSYWTLVLGIYDQIRHYFGEIVRMKCDTFDWNRRTINEQPKYINVIKSTTTFTEMKCEVHLFGMRGKRFNKWFWKECRFEEETVSLANEHLMNKWMLWMQIEATQPAFRGNYRCNTFIFKIEFFSKQLILFHNHLKKVRKVHTEFAQLWNY